MSNTTLKSNGPSPTESTQPDAVSTGNTDTITATGNYGINPANPALQTKESIADDGFVIATGIGSGLVPDELAPLQKFTSGIDMMDINTVGKEIGKACKQEAKQKNIAVKASVIVTSYAWMTGKLILRAKSLLKKRGEFGEWCEKHLVKPGLMSVKTAQRYMAVAKNWDSLDALLAGVPNLWSAYQEAGVLPVTGDVEDPEDPENPGDGDGASGGPPADKVAEYLAEFSKLQKMLRRIEQLRADMDAEVPPAEQEKINLIAVTIIDFASKLRGKTA